MKKVILSAIAVSTLVMADGVEIKSKAPVIEFSGTHYLGFVNSSSEARNGTKTDTDKFEGRRNYFQAKAFFKENPKDYMRVTMDVTSETDAKHATYKDNTTSMESEGVKTGYQDVILKYAYLYLDDVLPSTGVELGQAHRPWIDYEEHGGWNYRSISKVFVEDKNAAHLTNSADVGVNFKTKTPYFSSEIGVFNGEGYHGTEDKTNKMSAEWRLTGHILGTGKDKAKSDKQYANVSYFGQKNKNKGNTTDLNWHGVHAVYNQPEFLLSAQYIETRTAEASTMGNGYSLNAEARVAPKLALIGRYDNYKMDDATQAQNDKTRTIAGVSYDYNKNVKFIANYQGEEFELGTSSSNTTAKSTDALMLTAEVKW
jgi:hypothetical protein